MKTVRTLPTHEKCPHCGNKRKIPLYVYAHWSDTFTTTCEKCGKTYEMFHGVTHAHD